MCCIKKFLIIIYVILYSSLLNAYFDSDFISSKSLGLGNCGVINDNSPNELMVNPSLPMLNTRYGFEGLYLIKPVIDKYYNFIGTGVYRLIDDILLFGGTYQETLSDIISTEKYFIGGSYHLLADLIIGGRVDFLVISPAGFQEDSYDNSISFKSGIAAGFGLYYYTFDYLKFSFSYNGISIKDAKKYITQDFNIGIFYTLGWGVDLYVNLKLKEDTANSIGYKSNLNFGFNKVINKHFQIRSGYPSGGFSLGATISYEFINLDYGVRFSLIMGYEHLIGVRIVY